MDEQIRLSIIENHLMKLGSSISREIGLMYGVRSELGKLQEKLSIIKAVLVDNKEEQQRSHAVAIGIVSDLWNITTSNVWVVLPIHGNC